MAIDITNTKILSPKGYIWSLKPFELCLRSGTITILQGDNGSGKSNLLKILSGVLLPNYSVNSFLPDNADPVRTSGFIQPIPFDPQLSLKRNKQLWGITPFPCDQKTNYESNLERLGLSPYLKTKWGSASSGTRQKFGIAIALSRTADLYFLDEPLAHVDAGSTEIITEMIREKCSQGSAIMVTTHQIKQWTRNFDHYYHIADGLISSKNKQY